MLTFSTSPERFLVDEIPAYPPAGQGDHTFVRIEKRGLTTFEAIARLAEALDLSARDVGYAGLKDRHATTRQWLSLPKVPPERALELALPGLAVLEAVCHQNKLRLGHLRGNRFEVVLTGPATTDEVTDLRSRFAAMAATGLPNHFGAQRFGAGADNAPAGLAILRGERRERDGRRRRLLLSAIQSAVFNRYLDLRAAGGPLSRVIGGDVLRKTDTGGLFVSTDPAVDQARVDSGAVVPTGPMPGGREIEPPPETPARALEDAAIAGEGATREDFTRAGRELPGARRPVLLAIGVDDAGEAVTDETAEPAAAERVVRVRFSLPPGGYATVVVAALTRSAG